MHVNDQLRNFIDELQIPQSTSNENHVFLSMTRFLRYQADHILFWTLTVFFHGYTQLELLEKAGTLVFLLEVFVRNGLLALSVYLILLKAIPLLMAGRTLIGSTIIIGSILIYIIIKDLYDFFLIEKITLEMHYSFIHRTIYNASIVIFYVAFASTLYLSKKWYQQREVIRKIEIENLNTELNYLRAQMNPHFLFNSINTLFFQIDKQNSVARETLNKFSDLLRYQLYECNRLEIAIEKELHYLKNYMDLQRMRMNENFKIEFTVDLSLQNFNVPPLLLLPFVENAFKHVSHNSNKPNEISVHLMSKGHQLTFTVRNTTEDSTEPSTAGGIGLANITRRLDLLYGQQYELRIQKEAGCFVIILNIPIV